MSLGGKTRYFFMPVWALPILPLQCQVVHGGSSHRGAQMGSSQCFPGGCFSMQRVCMYGRTCTLSLALAVGRDFVWLSTPVTNIWLAMAVGRDFVWLYTPVTNIWLTLAVGSDFMWFYTPVTNIWLTMAVGPLTNTWLTLAVGRDFVWLYTPVTKTWSPVNALLLIHLLWICVCVLPESIVISAIGLTVDGTWEV